MLRSVYLEPDPFTSSNNKLTVSQKPNRTLLASFYSSILENLYNEVDLQLKSSKTMETLKELVQQTLHTENVNESENFLNIGGDSLSAINLTSLINKTFNTKIPAKMLAMKNFDEIAMYLEYGSKMDLLGVRDREKPDLVEELKVLNNLRKPTMTPENPPKIAFLTGASGIKSFQSESNVNRVLRSVSITRVA